MDPADSIYNYVPSRTVAIIFVVLFAVSTTAHVGQAIFHRLWWAFPTICLAGAMEILGWSGRLWSSYSPSLNTPFQIQIVCTIMAPTPLVAASFLILGRTIHRLGPAFSRLSPRNYSIIFVSCDLISLIIQGVGGGIASAADNEADANKGGNVMLGGIVFQLVVITFYALFAAEFIWRYYTDRPVSSFSKNSEASINKPVHFRGVLSRKLSIMLLALVFEAVFLYIRAIYRTIELSDGWNGTIISTEVYFNVFDGAMVVLAIYTLNSSIPASCWPSPNLYKTISVLSI
ncbi:RTA1 like protein-domain-containing protein [Mucidula mucida]|nr:RTA1 like protein-domain-containing protein [Mucidula mucida]